LRREAPKRACFYKTRLYGVCHQSGPKFYWLFLQDCPAEKCGFQPTHAAFGGGRRITANRAAALSQAAVALRVALC
jgi:hypothetical protein